VYYEAVHGQLPVTEDRTGGTVLLTTRAWLVDNPLRNCLDFEGPKPLSRNHDRLVLIKARPDVFTKGIEGVVWFGFEERRQSPRRPAGHIGKIITEHGVRPRYCLVIDASDQGVRVRTTSDFQVPDKFTLHYASIEGTYKAVWRRGVLAGAQLISPR